jgi:hypothetical protein
MQMLLQWFHEQSNLVTLFQILLDLFLIALIVIFIGKRPKKLVLPGYEELVTSLEQIVKETRQIATEFDANLQERHQLIQQILSQLDLRLDEARTVAQQLENTSDSAKPLTPKKLPSRTADQQEIVRLAQQGLTAETIATRLQKPLGEVELILKLQKLASR